MTKSSDFIRIDTYKAVARGRVLEFQPPPEMFWYVRVFVFIVNKNNVVTLIENNHKNISSNT